MQASIEGNVLVIKIALEAPRRSSTGKSLVVASTGGFANTTAQIGGKTVKISLNAIIPTDEPVAAARSTSRNVEN